MSQVLERPTRPDPAEALDDLAADVEISPSDLLERLWRFFISMRTGLFLILGLGLLSLAGTLLEQAPAGVRDDPQAYAAWLDSLRPRYGGWTTVLDKAGLLSVFSSWLFRGTVVLLAASLVACSVNRAPHLWDRATRPPRRRSDAFYAHAALRAGLVVPAAPADVAARVQDVLRSKRFRAVTSEDDGTVTLYADQHRWAPFGTVVTHLSFVLILLGFVLTATTGFKDNQVTVPVGEKVAVGHGTGLTVEATSFSDTYYANGSPKDYASDLVLYKGGQQVTSRTVRVNHPMRYAGVSFYQSFFGIAAAMRATDAKGGALFTGSVPMLWQSQDGRHSIGRFAVPAKGLTVYVVSAASGRPDPSIPAGSVQLEIYGASSQDTPEATQVVSQGKPATVGGVTYTFQRTRQFTGLIVSRDPGTTFVWLGCALMVLGIFLVLTFPHRRLWVRVRGTAEGTEIRCAGARGESAHRDSAYEARFQELVDDISLAADRSGTQEEAQRC
jgi:cytochrome c biogenesis protein